MEEAKILERGYVTYDDFGAAGDGKTNDFGVEGVVAAVRPEQRSAFHIEQMHSGVGFNGQQIAAGQLLVVDQIGVVAGIGGVTFVADGTVDGDLLA